MSSSSLVLQISTTLTSSDCSCCFSVAPTESAPREFIIDLNQEEQLGEIIVCPFIHEEIAGKWVNGVAFIKPGVSIEELNEDVNQLQLTDSLVMMMRRKALTAPLLVSSVAGGVGAAVCAASSQIATGDGTLFHRHTDVSSR